MKLSTMKSILLATALSWPMMAAAQEVNLKSADGSIDLTGELIEYQDNVYVISSMFGAVRINANEVDCFGNACPDIEVLNQEVTFSGSDTIAEGLLPVLLASYASSLEAEPIAGDTVGSFETTTQFIEDFGFGSLTDSFRVRSSISSDAFVNLLGKSAEIGVSSRRITVEEARMLRDYGAGSMVKPSNEHIVANDSIIVVTHPSNPVKSITMQELAAVYRGDISNWAELGGPDAPINAVHLGRGAGTRSVFEERVLEGAPGTPVNVVDADSIVEVARKVDEDKFAIGYVSFAFKRGAQALTLVNECGIAQEPSEFAAKTGEYLLQRPLYFYTREDTITDKAEEFLDWAKSDEADTAIFKSGFIDLGVERQDLGADDTRVANLRNAGLDNYEMGFAEDMISTMQGYDRLSSTFRFRAGSNRLTPQSRVGMERLISYLEDQPAGEVLLVGFTDDQGPFDANLNVSLDRAAHMVREIEDAAGDRLDHITFTTAGYGELAPVACNASGTGRAINRRIEVWTKTGRA